MSLKVEKFSGIDVLGIEATKLALKYSILADQPINLIGPPGVGKSAIVADVSKDEDINLPFEPLILSLCDPTDIGGFPVTSQDKEKNRGQVDRLPLGVIKRACNEPVMLFLDELSCAAPAVQGAAMRLVYERWAGDVKLHSGTRIVAAMNPPDQAAGGWEIALPLLGRMTQIKMRPLISEIQEYFYKLGKEGSELRNLGVDLAATLEMAPDLMHIDPPPGSASTGRAWGAPRSWERAMRVAAEVLKAGQSDTGIIFGAALAGNVGEDSACSYMTIRKVRNGLPSIKEILNDPIKAKLPHDTNASIAVLGILAQVSQTDPCPAWIYADRLQNETRVAAMNIMGKFGIQKFKSSKYYKQADDCQTKLLRGIGGALRA